MSFPTSWNDFTTSTEYGSRTRPLAQRDGDVYFVIHHAVNRRVQDTIALSKPGGRKVSMTFAVGPTQAGVEVPVYCVGVVPESARPFTTASSIDDRAFTVEVSNIDLTADYPVAAAAKEWLAQIAAYMHTQFGMPLDRVHVLSHQEVYRRGLGSYATACPGPDLQRSLDDIISRAATLTNPTMEEHDMRLIRRADGSPEWSLFHPSLSGPSDIERGYYVITDPAEAANLARLWAPNGSGSEKVEPRTVYTAMQAAARISHANYLRSFPRGSSGSVDMKPVLDAVAKVPTAEQNGAAARAAIVAKP